MVLLHEEERALIIHVGSYGAYPAGRQVKLMAEDLASKSDDRIEDKFTLSEAWCNRFLGRHEDLRIAYATTVLVASRYVALTPKVIRNFMEQFSRLFRSREHAVQVATADETGFQRGQHNRRWKSIYHCLDENVKGAPADR
jgi:hypothetical protein